MKDADLLERLVSIPSPTGREAAAVEFLHDQARRDGFHVIDDPAGNFVAEAGRGRHLLLFVGHIDTVPGTIPVRREGNILWGRGSVDAKGPLVAAYAAARRHLHDPDLRVRIVGAVDEEGNSRGAKAVPTDLDPAWILIGEPSGVHGLTLGYKGIVRGEFRLERPRTHGAHREPTAVETAIAFWRSLEAKYAFADHYDTVQGRLDALNTQTDGLADRVTLRFNLRLPPDRDPDEVASELAQEADAAGLDLDVDERMAGAQASKRSSLVAAFLAEMRSRGAQPHLRKKTGTADFNLFARRHPGVPIAAYGPGDAALDHTPHERIDLDEFAQSVEILDAVFRRFGAIPRGTQDGTTPSRADAAQALRVSARGVNL